MTNITKSSLDTFPTPIPIHVRDELHRLTNRLVKLDEVGLRCEIDVAPSDEAKQSLDARRARIANWMLPAGPEQTLKELAKLFATMAIRAADDNERKMATRVYVEDLMDLPLFALVAACKAFRTGFAGGGTWAPTQAEIRIEAGKAMGPLVKEKREIEAVLNAVVRLPANNQEHRRTVIAKELEKIKNMRQAGLDAEAERLGPEAAAYAEKARKEREAKQAETDRIAALIKAGQPDTRPMPLLSEDSRRKFVASNNGEAAA